MASRKTRAGTTGASSSRPHTRTRLHPFIDFSDVHDPDLRARWEATLAILRSRVVDHGKSLSWPALEQMDMGDEFRAMLSFDYERDGIIVSDSAWESMTHIRERVYVELVQEFFSTYSFMSQAAGHTAPEVVSFRLCGVFHRISLLDFAVRLGLYSVEQTQGRYGSILLEYLGACHRDRPADFDYQDTWSHFGQGQFAAGRTTESAIADTRYRLLHRVICCTVVPRSDGQEKIRNKDLWVLQQFLPQGRRLDLPYLLATALQDVIDARPISPICLGFIVTRLAISFDLLTPPVIASLTLVRPDMSWIDLEHMRRMRVSHIADRRSFWGSDPNPRRQRRGQPRDEEMEEPDAPDQPDEPHVDVPQFAAPQLQSWEQVFGDRLSRIELEQQREREENQRRFRYIAYGMSQTQYTADWTQRYVSQWTGPMTPPTVPEPYQPPPYLDPMDPDPLPPGFQTWEDWFARQR